MFGIWIFVLGMVSCLDEERFSWTDYNDTSFLGVVRNQNFPAACNSDWAFSSISVLNSRIKISRRAASPDIQLSEQVLLSCDTLDFGCLGGEPYNTFKWITNNNITDNTCQAYKAKGYTTGTTCNSQAKCEKCSPGGKDCASRANSKIYGIKDYGTVAGVSDMKEQIRKYGPIVCGVHSSGLKNYTGGILEGSDEKVDHYVVIYGWDQTDGVEYWRGRNSWGAMWGEGGDFRIKTSDNALGIESRCFWASPLDTWTNDERNQTLPSISSSEQNPQQKISYSLPKYLTASKTSTSPSPCSVSWAFSVLHMLSDRQSIQTQGKHQIELSAQALLNCGVGSCSKGGTPHDALNFIQKFGLPEAACQGYLGTSPSRESCSGINNCATCSGTPFHYNCTEVKGYKRWRIFDYNTVIGISNMKSEIASYGPIVCGVHASEEFLKYRGGIFSEISIKPEINHYVEVIGWGQENGKSYWLGRNSWGTAWGESSFFRIQMGSNNLGIETKCYFGNTLI